jgi:hypothetical protein
VPLRIVDDPATHETVDHVRERDPAPALPMLVFFALSGVAVYLALILHPHYTTDDAPSVTVEVGEDFFNDPINTDEARNDDDESM